LAKILRYILTFERIF